MGGSDENRHGVIGPMNPQGNDLNQNKNTNLLVRFCFNDLSLNEGGLRGGKVNPGNGQTRRALSNINKNIIGAPVYPCAVNKRPLSE